MNMRELKEKLEVSFLEEVEYTYVIQVIIGEESFEVNCQFGTAYNYRQSNLLACYNDSGNDIGSSGLTGHLEDIGFDEESDGFEYVVNKIEECANEQLPENTIERVISDKEDEAFKFENYLFGAFGPHDVHHSKYTSETGTIVVTSEDVSELRAENQLLGYKTFYSQDDYEKWMDYIYQNGEYHYGDCSTSYRAWQDITGKEDEYDDRY